MGRWTHWRVLQAHVKVQADCRRPLPLPPRTPKPREGRSPHGPPWSCRSPPPPPRRPPRRPPPPPFCRRMPRRSPPAMPQLICPGKASVRWDLPIRHLQTVRWDMPIRHLQTVRWNLAFGCLQTVKWDLPIWHLQTVRWDLALWHVPTVKWHLALRPLRESRAGQATWLVTAAGPCDLHP